MTKRFKLIALVMALVVGMSFTAPSAALAYYHYYRPYYHHHHHHHWSSGKAWAWGLGILGLSLFAHHNTNKAYTQPVVYDYDSAKSYFISSLDDKESALFIELNTLEPSSSGRAYRYYYGESEVTKRRLKKIMTTLSREYHYIGVKDGYLYFNKLR